MFDVFLSDIGQILKYLAVSEVWTFFNRNVQIKKNQKKPQNIY